MNNLDSIDTFTKCCANQCIIYVLALSFLCAMFLGNNKFRYEKVVLEILSLLVKVRMRDCQWKIVPKRSVINRHYWWPKLNNSEGEENKKKSLWKSEITSRENECLHWHLQKSFFLRTCERASILIRNDFISIIFLACILVQIMG
jgi:hypothetical protein